MSIYENFQPIDLEKISTYELASRPSKVTTENFAAPVSEKDSLKEFLSKLPDILAVQSLREIAKQIRRARDLNKPIVFGIGGHIIKTGLAPVIIDLDESRFRFGNRVERFGSGSRYGNRARRFYKRRR